MELWEYNFSNISKVIAPLTNLFELFGHWYIENQSKDWFFCCYTPTFSLEVIQRNHPKRKDGENYDKDYWARNKFWWFSKKEIRIYMWFL